MIKNKVQLCITLLKLSRLSRGSVEEDKIAQEVYLQSLRSLIEKNPFSKEEFDQINIFLFEEQNRKPTIQMKKIPEDFPCVDDKDAIV